MRRTALYRYEAETNRFVGLASAGQRSAPPGPIHLLLTDVVMPQMNGREVAEELARLRPEMKVLYMSGYTFDIVVLHGVAEADTALLQKPFTLESLTSKVREVLDANRGWSAEA